MRARREQHTRRRGDKRAKAGLFESVNRLKQKAKGCPEDRIAPTNNNVGLSGVRIELRDVEMPKTNKSAKAAGKMLPAKTSKDMPILRAITGGKAAPPPKLGPAKPAAKPPIGAIADDAPETTLYLAPVTLSPAMAPYFKK